MKIDDRTWIRIMEMGAKLGCHQMPERSFFVKGYQFPVCARCTGVIISAVIALIVFFKKKIQLRICFALSCVMLCDWGMQYLKIRESTNTRRFVTGLIGGFGYSTLHMHFYYFIYKKIKKLFR